MIFPVIIVMFLVDGVLSTEVTGSFYGQPPYYSFRVNLNTPLISITAENEPIEVNATHISPYGNEDVSYVTLEPPHTFKFVPIKLFETFKNLKQFSMSSVGLSTMTTNAFRNCLKLEGIQMYYNNFSLLPASFAEDCVNIKSLYLELNHIKIIDKDAFKGLSELITVSLGGNEFTFLDPSTFSHTPKLNQISIHKGKLLSIHPDTFANLSPLYLGFPYNEIEVLPSFKFASVDFLYYLDFQRNQINAIDPDLLATFPVQKYYQGFFLLIMNDNICINGTYDSEIDFSGFQTCFDNWNIMNTGSAGTIGTTRGKITTREGVEWPTEAFVTEPEVTTEDFVTDPVTTIRTPKVIESTSSPLDVPCETCISRKVCRYFLNHDEVYSCVLSNVELVLSTIDGRHEVINQKAFTDLDVKAVYFKNSVLARVPSVIFTKFPNIELLSIPNTQMTIIDDNTFQTCGEKLQQLDVSDNHITSIEKASLVKCQNLETINLSGNPIEDLDGELFKIDPKLKHVLLNKN